MAQPGARNLYFYSLDGIRGLAAMLVVLRHTGNYFGGIDFPVSYLAVDVFFLLSGVVLAGSYEKRLNAGLSSTSFMWIRMARIYPLYILGSVVTIVAVASSLNHELSITEVLAAMPLSFVLLPSTLNGFPLNGPAWSVFFELIVNFSYGFFFKSLTDRALKAIVSVSAVLLIAIVAAHPKHHLDVGFSFPFYPGLFRTTYSFFLGVLLYRKFSVSTEPKVPILIKRILPWPFIGVIFLLLISTPTVTIRPYLIVLLVFFVFPALIYFSLWFQPTGFGARICQSLGTASYGIYAIHAPLAVFVSGFFDEKIGLNVDRYAPWSGVIFLIMLFLLCLILDRFYDRPFRRFLLQNGRPPQPIKVSGS